MQKKIEEIKMHLRNAEYLFVGIIVFTAISVSIMLMIYIPSASNLINSYAETVVQNSSMGSRNISEEYFSRNMTYLLNSEHSFYDIDISDDDAVRETCIKIADGGDFRHIGFTRITGDTISSTGGAENTSSRVFIRKGLEGEDSIFAHIACDFDNKICDMYSVPVRNSSGTLLGVLSGDIDSFSFSSMPVVDIAGDRNCYFILNSDGRVLYCSAENKAGLSEGDDLLKLISDNKVSKEIEYYLNSVTEEEFKNINIGSTEYMAAFSPMQGKDWTFAAIIPKSVVMSSFNTLIVFTVGALGVMALLLTITSAIIALRIKQTNNEIGDAVEDSFRKLYVDSITGHDTVEKFRENYEAAMKDTASGHALISLDVDRFKAVNDTFGFDGGNEIIRQLSGVIKRSIGKNDFFMRSNGDLFYILAEFTENSSLAELCERIISDVDYQITSIKLTLSIGIYIIDDPNIKSRVAADRADMARESTKGRKESRYVFFDSSMLRKIRREKKIEDIMEDSLALGEFLVYLQPKFGLGEQNNVVGAEALVRWKHEGKLIPPGEFIPLFEKNGFVNKIDYYIFEEVCKLQKKYMSMGYEPKVISVNMSRTHIHQPGFVSELAAMCEKYEVDTKYLEIEITESAAFEDMEILCDIFKEIKKYGFHVSIDDFGTGYSSLNMLKDLPVDVLKIDRSFLTENADENESASVIIGCVVTLATALGIRTICEGIETKEQAALLTKLGCNMAQGFYFARPMPVSDYEQLTYGI